MENFESTLKAGDKAEVFDYLDAYGSRILREMEAEHRWSSVFREIYVVDVEGSLRYFEVIIEKPATEMQEVDEPIQSIAEVYPVERTVIDYE